MPVHGRITSINAFATGKTPPVPMEANYVEDYFDVQTFTRGLTNNGAQKVTTYVDMSQPEDEGCIWHKFTGETGDYQVVTKLTPSKQIVANGQTIGIGSEQIILNNNPQLAAISNVTLDAGGGNGAAVDFDTHNDGYVVHSTDFAKQSVGNDNQLDLNLSVQFKKKKKFFDVQTWTGDGVYGKEIFHDLDCEPGFIMIKRLDANDDWFAYHKYSDPTAPERYWYYALMDGQARKWVSNSVYALKPNGTKSVLLCNTTASSSAGQYTNYNGAPYIGYFFADKGSGGFGDDGTEDAIACGVGVVRADRTDADAFNECGFEPDLVLVRNKTETDYWRLINTSSGWFDGYWNDVQSTDGRAKSPFFNTTSQSAQTSWMKISNEANGFWVESGTGSGMGEGDEFIWIAIRKPQRTPIQENVQRSGIGGTCFFQAFKGSGINRTPREQPGFSPDMAFTRTDLFNGSSVSPYVQFKTLGNMDNHSNGGIQDCQIYSAIFSNSNYGAYKAWISGVTNFDIGLIEKGYIVNSASPYITDANTAMYVFRKARGFFDTIAWSYVSGGVGIQTVRHSLGVKPEFVAVKATMGPNGDYNAWKFYHAGIGATMGASIGSNNCTAFAAETWWNNTEPTKTELFTGPGVSNGSTQNNQGFRGFMFSSIEGICKVGVYTGTNQAIDVNCGFSSAPRFLMIKNANTTDNFYIWDNMQGMSPSPVESGEEMWGTPGNYTFTAPAGVTEISVVLVGGGGGGSQGAGGYGGGGGALAWKNNITVVPGTSYNVIVGAAGTYGGSSGAGQDGADGGNSTLTVGSDTYIAYGGKGGDSPSGPAGAGGTRSANTDGGGDGGRGGWRSNANAGGGGGGAGGYSGDGGGAGCQGTTNGDPGPDGADGAGGAGGGGGAGSNGNDQGGAGGGVGVYGEGDSGTGADTTTTNGPGGGGGSESNTLTPPGPNNNVGGGRNGTGGSWSTGADNDGYFGGGGGAQGGSSNSMSGAKGAVRIIWGENAAGAARTFPDAATAGSLFDPYWQWNKDSPQVTSKDYVGVTTTGFGISGGAITAVNDSGSTFIYLAIA